MDASRVVHLASRQESSAPISTDIQTGDPQVDTLLRLLSGGFQQQV